MAVPSAAAAEADWQTHVRRLSCRLSRSWRPNSSAACAANLPADWAGNPRPPDARRPAPARARSRRANPRRTASICWSHRVPELLGGSADLTGSNLTAGKTSVALHDASAEQVANYISYGVREFGMAAIMNGVAAARRPDSLRRHLRRVLRLFAQRHPHERADEAARRPCPDPRFDRPRRGRSDPPAGRARQQPARHSRPRPLAAVRRTGNGGRLGARRSSARTARRPCCCRARICRNTARRAGKADDIARGGYVLVDGDGPLQAVIIATGSEVALAMQAQAQLKAEGVAVRVVSMPCTRRFDRQPATGRSRCCRHDVCRIAIEAGADRLLAQVCRSRRRRCSGSTSSANRRRPRPVRTFWPDRRASGANCRDAPLPVTAATTATSNLFVMIARK